MPGSMVRFNNAVGTLTRERFGSMVGFLSGVCTLSVPNGGSSDNMVGWKISSVKWFSLEPKVV